MTRLFLDTSVIVALLRGRDLPETDGITGAVRGGDACYNGIVVTELLSGVRNKKMGRQVAKITLALGFLPLEYEDFRSAGKLRSRLLSDGLRMSTPDALIAAHVLRHNLKLLTLDAFFLKLPVELGLRIEIPG